MYMFILTIESIFSMGNSNQNPTTLETSTSNPMQVTDDPERILSVVGSNSKPKEKKSSGESSLANNGIPLELIIKSPKQKAPSAPSTDKNLNLNDEEKVNLEKIIRLMNRASQQIRKTFDALKECSEGMGNYLRSCGNNKNSKSNDETSAELDSYTDHRGDTKYEENTIKNRDNVPELNKHDASDCFLQRRLGTEEIEKELAATDGRFLSVPYEDFPDIIRESRPSQASEEGVDEVDDRSLYETREQGLSFSGATRVAMFPNKFKNRTARRERNMKSRPVLRVFPTRKLEQNEETDQSSEIETKNEVPVTDLDEDSDETSKIPKNLVKTEPKKEVNSKSDEKSKIAVNHFVETSIEVETGNLP